MIPIDIPLCAPNTACMTSENSDGQSTQVETKPTDTLTSSRVVLVGVPYSGHPPVSMTLADIVVGRGKGSISPSAVIQFEPNEPTIPVDKALAGVGLSWRPAVIGLLVVPPILALLHHLVFGAGAGFMLLLWLVCLALAAVAVSFRQFQIMTSRELIRELGRSTLMWVLVAIAGALFVCAMISAGQLVSRQNAISNALVMTDDCKFVDRWKELGPDTHQIATESQINEADRKERLCEEEQAREKAAAYVARCEKVVKSIEGELTDEAANQIARSTPAALPNRLEYLTGTDGVEMARRIATGTLITADLRSEKLPCGKVVREPYLRAVAVSVSAWAGLGGTGELSYDLKKALGFDGYLGNVSAADRVLLSPDIVAAVSEKAEQKAKTSLRARKSEDALEAERACLLAEACVHSRGDGQPPLPSCNALDSRLKQLRAKEKAAAEVARRAQEAREAYETRVRDAKEKAAERLCDATRAANERCNTACDNRYGFSDNGVLDDYWLACGERCDIAIPIRGCE